MVMVGLFLVASLAPMQADATKTTGAESASSRSTGANKRPLADSATAAPAKAAAPKATASGPVDLATALADAIEAAKDPARIAVLPVTGGDDAMTRRVESALLRGVIEMGLEPITPATIRNVLGARAFNVSGGVDNGKLRELSADHILEAAIVGSDAGVALKVIHVESGTVVARKTAVLSPDDAKRLRSTRSGVARLVDEVVVAMAQNPGELRLSRVAVAPFASLDESAEALKLDRLIRAQVEEGLLQRGFLVVEREKFDAVSAQLALGTTLTEESAPKVGKALGAQAFIFGSIADGGEYFVVTARIVDANTGRALGAATSNIRRQGAVTMAAGSIETRTPGEALFRSAVAPGWGQAYNQQPVKSVVFGALTYGSLAVSAALVVTGAIFAASYVNYVPPAGAAPDEYAPLLTGMRQTANTLYVAAAVGAGVTATAWGVNVADAYFSGTE